LATKSYRCQSKSDQEMVWLGYVDPRTGTTLSLKAHEVGEVAFTDEQVKARHADDFIDDWLDLLPAEKPERASKPAVTSTEEVPA